MTVGTFEPQEHQQNGFFEPQEDWKASSPTLEQIMTDIKYRGTKEDFANVKADFYLKTAEIQQEHHLTVRYVVTLVLLAMGVVFAMFALFIKFFPNNLTPFSY